MSQIRNFTEVRNIIIIVIAITTINRNITNNFIEERSVTKKYSLDREQ